MIPCTQLLGFTGEKASFILLKRTGVVADYEVVYTDSGATLTSKASLTQERGADSGGSGFPSIAASPNSIIAVSGSAGSFFLKNDDGVVFSEVALTIPNMGVISYGNGNYLTVQSPIGSARLVSYSSDEGVTWGSSTVSTSPSASLHSVLAGDSFAIAVGGSGTFGSSDYWYNNDVTTNSWTKVVLGTGNYNRGIYANGYFCLCGASDRTHVISESAIASYTSPLTNYTLGSGNGGIAYSPELDMWIRSIGEGSNHRFSYVVGAPTGTWAAYNGGLSPTDDCEIYWTGKSFLLVNRDGQSWYSYSGLSGSWIASALSGGATSGDFSLGIRNIFA
jgi:hypothetical protein